MTMGKECLSGKLDTGRRVPKVSAGTGRECPAPCPSGNGLGEVVSQRRLTHSVQGSALQGASSDAELAVHFIPAKSCVRVAEMGRPAPIQLSEEVGIERQRPVSGLVATTDG